ncbi:3-keto-disaccharide hydrolase [Roseivirga sp.]|uniref:3-keto-disaccharide hydrolase n=1 Tax=Roseivirga sp. TaxID=1964215 RepID=UPI003B8D3DB0
MKRAFINTSFLGLVFLCLLSCNSKEDEWIQLFNGKDLDGWTPKITGYDVGENYGNTFRVVDGLLTVSYDKYYRFENRFGHLFYKDKFSDYLLRIEYRFIGEQAEGGEQWALKNSGVMLHAQSPESMNNQQDFPISLEAQFLGGLNNGERPTGSLCTPGTHVDIDNEFTERHCITSNAPTFHGEEWVTIDILVRNNQEIAHIIEGDTIIKYTNPIIGGGVVNNFKESAKADGKELKEGFIALQSESHPIQFRTVMLKDLSK